MKFEHSEVTNGYPDVAPRVQMQDGAASNSRQKGKNASGTRKDKGKRHATHHAALSRFPLQALAARGENIRQLKKAERLLRAELRVTGIIAKMIFDRGWSAHLKSLLVRDAEMQVFTPVNDGTGITEGTPELLILDVPTLHWPERDQVIGALSDNLVRQLSIFQRYDAHLSREFYRAIGLLIAMRDATATGLTRHFIRTLGQANDREDLK